MSSSHQCLLVRNLYFSHLSVQPLIENLSCGLHQGEHVALTGSNGVGKSTFLSLIGSKLEPTRGVLRVSGVCVQLSQHVLENSLPTLDLKKLSGGEARREVLRSAFACTPDLLVLDEPTNDLDAGARAELLAWIENFSGALLVATHDPDILDRVTRIWELRSGTLVEHPPGYEAYVERLKQEELRKQETLRSLEAQKKRVERQLIRASESQQKRMLRGEKAGIKKNIPKIIRGAKKQRAERTLAKIEDTHQDRLQSSREQAMDLKGTLRKLSSFAWSADTFEPLPRTKLVCRCEGPLLDLELRGPRKVHLRGPNGSGKTTLLRSLTTGTGLVAVPYALFDQRLQDFDTSEKLYEYFQRHSGLEMSQARSRLGRVGFEQELQLKAMRDLSGGERVRLHLQALLARSPAPQLLLLDEPTNHLDLESRLLLVEFVRSFPGAVILVSHDERFVAECGIGECVEMKLRGGHVMQ